MNRVCVRCGKPFEGRSDALTCSSTCRTEVWMQKRRDWLNVYKRERGCIDCGAAEGRLDLDHRPGTVKLFDPAHGRVSWAKLFDEVAKCDVRCASCHSARHGRDRGGLNASVA